MNTGNMYSIPEHPSSENLKEENYCEIPLSVKKEASLSKVRKKASSSSLPERTPECRMNNLDHKNNSIPILITTEVVEEEYVEIMTVRKTFLKDFNRLSVSLADFSNSGLAPDNRALKIDKNKNAFANVTSFSMTSEQKSKSYLEVKDCISYSDEESKYETLHLSPNGISAIESKAVNCPTHGGQKSSHKDSDQLDIVDLNDEEKQNQGAILTPDGPSCLRQRSRSMQWLQNAFQNVTNRYKNLLEIRRPSDIAEERMRRSQEELEMEESESSLQTEEKTSSNPAGRRYSENIIGKQKRSPFVTRLGHLRDLWRGNAVSKRQEDKDIDQTRTDVCPLFTFPRKRDNDEQILDALRQAMRKCTAVDPTTRPTSTAVLAHLSKLSEGT